MKCPLTALLTLTVCALVTRPAASDVPETERLEKLWKTACLWQVGANAETVPAARQELIALGEPVLDFVIPSRLDTNSTLVTRALNEVIRGVGAEAAVPRLLPCLVAPQGNVRRNAAELLGALDAKAAAPAIARLLTDADARLGALSALGALGERSVVPQVAELLASSAPERVRVTAATALGRLGGDAAAASLREGLSLKATAVRFACEAALVSLKATDVLLPLLGVGDQRLRLHAIDALGQIADASARPRLLKLLADASPIVRGHALAALGPPTTPAERAAIERLRASETDPFVRGKLETVRVP